MSVLALQTGGAGMAFLIQLVAIIAIFYFILVVPHRREQKRHREMIAALKKGDEVVTTGGLIGEIIQMGDEKLTIRSGESRLVVERARIARLAGEPAGRR